MREICAGLQFPEGPVALANGDVLVVEIARGTLTRCRPDGSTEVVADCGGGPNGAAMGPGGKIYITNNGGFDWHHREGLRIPGHQPEDYTGGSIQVVDPDSGTVETLYTHCGERQLRGPNDLVFDDHGGFYFTDLGKGRHGELDRGAIFYAKADGSAISIVAAPLLTPNGVGLSPEGDWLYFAETMTGRVWGWHLAEPGVVDLPGPQLSTSSVPATLIGTVGGPGRVDSLAVDSEGSVCVATLTTGAITAVHRELGLRAVVPVPGGDPMITNVCFGGPDLTTAYITASGKGRLFAQEWYCPGHPLAYLNR